MYIISGLSSYTLHRAYANPACAHVDQTVCIAVVIFKNAKMVLFTRSNFLQMQSILS